MPTRIYTARAIHEIVAASELYKQHAFVCERLARALDDERPIGAVTRAKRALAAPLPTNARMFYRARKRGHLLDCSGQTPPLLWQLVGMRTSTSICDRPPTDRMWLGLWSAKLP
jgi:hypothetical protein